jgi:hypothetical protein
VAAPIGILRPLGNGLLTFFMKQSSTGLKHLESMPIGLMGLASRLLDAWGKSNYLIRVAVIVDFRVSGDTRHSATPPLRHSATPPLRHSGSQGITFL